MIALRKIAETNTTITLEWDSVPGAIGYRFRSATTTKWSHTFDVTRQSVKFSKAAWYEVEALGTKDAGRYPAVAPPPPPGDVTYPASYYSGPLGNKNPLPPKRGCFLGAWLSLPGGAITWPQHITRVGQREADMGRKYDFIMITDWDYLWPDNKLKWINDHGSLAVVGGLNFGRTVMDIAAGHADADIDRFADHWKALGFPIMVRLHHEMDLQHLIYHCVGREIAFRDAWRRIVERVANRGASNVGWWFCPMEGTARTSVDAAYPGDNYVDWFGTDNYNFDRVGGSGWATPLHSGWAEFWELFDYPAGPGYQSRHAQYGPRKPFVVAETNSIFDPNHPTKKGQWYRNIPAAAKNMEYLCGIGFFDTDATAENPEFNWLVDHPTSVSEIYAGWKALAGDPYFNSRA